MSHEIAIGDTVIDHFPAFEDDGVTKRPGLGSGDFTVTVFRDNDLESTPVVISEIGSTGEYSVTFVPDAYGNWKVQVLIHFNQEIWEGEFHVDSHLHRVLGLIHENAIVDNHQYDANNQLIGARLRVFDSAANVPSAPGGTESVGLLFEYQFTGEYAALGIQTLWSGKRVL